MLNIISPFHDHSALSLEQYKIIQDNYGDIEKGPKWASELIHKMYGTEFKIVGSFLNGCAGKLFFCVKKGDHKNVWIFDNECSTGNCAPCASHMRLIIP
jgi:hypothetical protein